jgi:hypothetical protein
LDAEQCGTVLWNLYWRGTAAVRERIEDELDLRERERQKKAAAAPPDPDLVLMEVRDFVELARSGAYIAGDRRVSRTERTKWRVTFRRLATEAQSALHATDSGPAEEAMELMIDLACHADGCFRSDDPLEAAKFVVSQAVSALWETVLDVRGAVEFTARAVPQLMRWKREYGWAHGMGAAKVYEAERPLAEVLAPMLTTQEMCNAVADAYLAELDRIAAADAPPAVKKNTRAGPGGTGNARPRAGTPPSGTGRAGSLAGIRRCLSVSTGERARRLAGHASFGGPEADFLKARRLPWDICRTARPLACSTTKYGSTASTSSPRPCVCWNVANPAGRRPSCLTRCLRSWR